MCTSFFSGELLNSHDCKFAVAYFKSAVADILQ